MQKSDRAIYITGLPTTVGQIQLEDICKSVGRIKKIKVYRDASGVPKGDATVVFEGRKGRDMAAEATAELDGKRVDQGGLGSYVITVQEAMFKPSQQPPPKPPEARKSFAPPDAPKTLLRNMFDSSKDYDAAQIKSLEDEVGHECFKYGRVLDAEFVKDDAAVLVTFASLESARNCATAMHGRYFDARIIRAELWTDGSRPSDEPPTKKSALGDYVGAPPPRTGEAPSKKPDANPNDATRRQRNATDDDAPKPPLMMNFVKAAIEPPPPPSDDVLVVPPEEDLPAPGLGLRPPSRKRTAADFFDD